MDEFLRFILITIVAVALLFGVFTAITKSINLTPERNTIDSRIQIKKQKQLMSDVRHRQKQLMRDQKQKIRDMQRR